MKFDEKDPCKDCGNVGENWYVPFGSKLQRRNGISSDHGSSFRPVFLNRGIATQAVSLYLKSCLMISNLQFFGGLYKMGKHFFHTNYVANCKKKVEEHSTLNRMLTLFSTFKFKILSL